MQQTKFINNQKSKVVLQHLIDLKVTTDAETKEYHLKKLYELSLKSIGQIPWVDDPSEEQLEWANRRVHSSTKSWEAFKK